MNDYVSKYKDNLIAKKTRVFLSCAFDFGLVFITSLLLFYLTLLGSSKLPISINNVKKYEDTTIKAKKFINTTHLMHYDTTTNVTTDVSVDAKNYVTTLVKTSAYIYDLAYPVEKNDSTFDKTHKVEKTETFITEDDKYAYELDNISYFFFVFEENGIKFMPEHEGSDIDYVYLTAMTYGSKEGFVNNFVNADVVEYQPYKDILPRYSVLTKANTEILINRIVYGEETNKTANELYENIQICYKNGVQTGIDLIEKNSPTYKAYSDDFYAAYNTLSLLGFLSYFIAYAIAYILLIFLGRGMAGEYITVSQKALNLAFARKDEMSPKAANIVIYHIINFFIYLSMMVIALFFTGYIGVLNLTLFGPINLFVVEIALVVLLLASIIFIVIGKKNQSLAMFASSLVIKDTREFENNTIDSNKLLSEENKLNGEESK